MAFIAELRSLGDSVCIANVDGVPPLSALNTESCAVYWDVFVRTAATDEAIREIFPFLEESCELKVEDLGKEDDGESPSGGGKKLGEILVERGKISKQALDRFLGSRKRIGELLVEERLVTEGDVKVTLEKQRQLQAAKRERCSNLDLATIRVHSEKLDKLIALVGELVTVQARVLEASRRHEGDADFQSVTSSSGA